MARLIKAVARCGLRFESGLPHGAKERVSLCVHASPVRVCVYIRVYRSIFATCLSLSARGAWDESGHEGLANKRVERIRCA